MTETIVQIEGMMCGMCESHINDVIRRNFTVRKVTSSHKKGEAVIVSEETIPEERLRAAIADTGYAVTGVESRPYGKKKWFR